MKKFILKHRIIIFTFALSLTTIGLIVFFASKRSASNSPTSTRRAASQTSPSPTPSLEPLAIDAIRARQYQGSAIKIERELGSQSGYKDSLISYTSDGYKIFALQSTPNGSPPPEGWPVVILNHGYIPPADYQTNGPEYRQFISALAGAGFVVIKPDYRGHGQSEGEPAGGHFSPAYTYDLLNLIASIKQTPGLNPARVGLLGHSMGAHVALRAAVSSNDIKALATMSGVVGSMQDIFDNWPSSPVTSDRPTTLVRGKRNELIAKYGEPKNNPSFWDSVSAINFVRYITAPVQIHHSLEDAMVPYLFSDHLAAALKDAQKSVEFHSYPGDDHQLIASRAVVLQRLVNFFKTNL